MSATQDLLRRLDIRHPIVQAPMAGVSTPALAAAVTNAGALGSIGVGACSLQQAEAMLQATRALTKGAINVNLFCHRPAIPQPSVDAAWLSHLEPFFAALGARAPGQLREIYTSFLAEPALLAVLLKERPQAVSFHFGLPPTHWIQALREAGITTLACVTNPEEGRLAEAAGVDALVAQGIEAGGHRGVFDPAHDSNLGLLDLVPLLVRQTDLPVVAAGGLMTGHAIRTVLDLGAAAAQLGTAFILCPESAADAQYRQALQSDRAGHTAFTAAISGRPARGLINRFFTEVGRPGGPAVPDYPFAYDAAKALHSAAQAQGCYDFAAQWAGQGAPLARALPAKALIDLLAQELSDASRGSRL